MPRPNPETWLCPLCDVPCVYGTMGCDAPETCTRGEKNIHWHLRGQVNGEAASIGIAAISDEDCVPDEVVRL
jgi:hypothetical protein